MSGEHSKPSGSKQAWNMSRGVSNQLPCWRRVSLGSEITLTRLQLAELVLEHPDSVVNEFREMKMQPSLKRALKHKEN